MLLRATFKGFSYDFFGDSYPYDFSYGDCLICRFESHIDFLKRLFALDFIENLTYTQTFLKILRFSCDGINQSLLDMKSCRI
jgi:hypothetical protein